MIDDTETNVKAISGKRRSLKPIILGLFILVCGIIIGGGLMSFVLWNSIQKPMRLYERMPDRIVEDMKTHIDISDDQAERIEKVFQNHLAVFDSIRQDVEPRIQNEIRLIETEIRDILTKEQQVQWEDRYMKFRRRWFPGPPRRHSHHGEGPPPFDEKSPPWHEQPVPRAPWKEVPPDSERFEHSR